MDLPDYRNFWLVWLSLAGHPKGTTLYKVQDVWGITTNYLYHKEAGLGKPLFQAMIDQGMLVKEGRTITAQFAWIPPYVIRTHVVQQKGWSPSLLILQNWPLLQAFIEANAPALFSLDRLRLLYKNSADNLTLHGHTIFTDLFALAFAASLGAISAKFQAHTVDRIIYTLFSLHGDKDLLGYFHSLSEVTFPTLIKDEEEMLAALAPLD